VNQSADEISITNSYEGDAQIALNNIAAGANETSGDGIKIVDFSETANVNGTFSLVGGGNTWDGGGAYLYEFGQHEGEQDYYLYSTETPTDAFKTMLNIPVMNVVMAQTGMNSLQRRVGDLLNMDGEGAHAGVWVRSYYKDMEVKDLIKTDMDLFGAEAGYDWLFNADEPTKIYAGVLVGFVNALNVKTEKTGAGYEKGKGEAPGVGVYVTLANESGWFIDIAARNFWTKLDMKSHTSNGVLNYNPKRNVLTGSIEVGKNIKNELGRDRYVRIEPKVELGIMKAEGSEATVSNGRTLKYDAANYVNAKAGVLLSYNTVMANGRLVEPLVEIAYRYEFQGKGDVTYDGVTKQSDLKGGTVEANAGINMQLTDNLYWYGLGSYEKSEKVSGWGLHAGIRYHFGVGNSKGRTTKAQKREPRVEQRQRQQQQP
jgi:outer membrane autotransporter protein